MEWLCWFGCCRPESQDLSKESQPSLVDSGTDTPNGCVEILRRNYATPSPPASDSDSSSSCLISSAMDESPPAVISAGTSRPSFAAAGALHTALSPATNPSFHSLTDSLIIHACTVDGHSPPFSSPVTSPSSSSWMTDKPASTTVPLIPTASMAVFSAHFMIKPDSSFSPLAAGLVPSHATGSLVSTAIYVPPSFPSRTVLPFLESSHSLSFSCPKSSSVTSPITGSCSPFHALFTAPTTSTSAVHSLPKNVDIKSPSLSTPAFHYSSPISVGSSLSSSPHIMATSDLPPHASLVQGPVPQAQNPSCSILGTSKPSVSTALQSGLFQSFTQTPNSLSCKPCAHASYLYNKPGRLCTIFDQRYVYIHHRDTYILVGLKRWISCGLTLGTRLAWKQCKPHFLSDLADGAKVKCDALSLPDTHGFHALVVWQGSKPSLIEEPTEEEEIMVLENHDLQVTCIVAIEGGGGSVDVDINGKSVKVWFTEKVVFVDGRRASTCDIFSSFNKSTNMVFATVHKVLKGGSEATLIYICSCLWSGTRPQAHLLSKLAQGDVYEKTQDGTYMKCSISQRVYCDIPAVLKTSAYGREIVLHSGDEVKHLPITTEDIYYQSASEVFPLPPEIPVLANIARLKGKNKSCVLKVIAVYLPSENTVVSSLSKESKKGFHPTSETKEYLQSKSENNGSGEKGNKLVANDKEEENALMEKSSKGVTKQIEYGQKEGNVKIEDDLERNIQRENAGKEGKIQKEGIVQRDNGQKQGNAKMEKDQEKCSIQIEKEEKENISQITEETHKGNDICIEDCIWQCGSISQGVAKTLQKYVLITYDVLYVNGKRIPSTDTVAKYSDKGSVVSVAIVPLATSYQVLGLTVTHKAIAAWQGSKPECVENLIKEHASGNDVHKSSKFIPVAKIQISVPCDRVTQSAPSLHESHVASEDLSKSSCAEYVPACRWKVAGISQGLICLKKKVVLVKHEVFFVDKTRVPNTDPMSKFANKESLVNAIVVSISSPQVILGHNITHEALVAWSGKKPDEADSYVAKYSREKSKLGRIPNTRLKTSSLQEMTNVARTLPNSGDEKTFSKEKMKVPGKAESKKSNADLTLPMKAKTTNDLSSEMRNTENKNMKATDTNAILPINQKKTQPRHAQGKLFKVVGNHGILEVRCRDLEGERAMAAFHRSVTYYLHQQKVDQKRSLEEQLSPHLSTGEDFYCYIVRHDMNIGGVACQYKATMVWVGKKPKLRTECHTGTRVNASQNAKVSPLVKHAFKSIAIILDIYSLFPFDSFHHYYQYQVDTH